MPPTSPWGTSCGPARSGGCSSKGLPSARTRICAPTSLTRSSTTRRSQTPGRQQISGCTWPWCAAPRPTSPTRCRARTPSMSMGILWRWTCSPGAPRRRIAAGGSATGRRMPPGSRSPSTARGSQTRSPRGTRRKRGTGSASPMATPPRTALTSSRPAWHSPLDRSAAQRLRRGATLRGGSTSGASGTASARAQTSSRQCRGPSRPGSRIRTVTRPRQRPPTRAC
mmetsp:Transcript_36264/g.92610  ORF Transcript_36264/g.92610 Transcript_36264/m.92610 type:complete len:225 (+) Transcript_36264:1009-1683(+)